jgi:hypothetical protein
MFHPHRSRRQNRAHRSRTFRAMPSLELLEARNLLSNIMVNNPAEDGVNRTQSETAIVLGSSSNVIVGFNDSAEYRQGATNHFTGYALSNNGGSSFTDEGALPNSRNGDVGDPGLARDNTSGTIYFSTIPFSGNGVQVFKSTNNGSSFGKPALAAKTIGGSDKPWITVDNATGKGQGNVYVTLTSFTSSTNIYLARSTNGGSKWGSPVTIASGIVQGSNVAVGTDHAVYVFWLDGNGSQETIMVRKSTDQGLTFGSAVTVATLATTGVNGDLGLNGGFRTNAFPQAAVNPANGNIYVAFDDVGQASGDRSDAYLVQSTDGGSTWGSRVKLNDDTFTNDQWLPAIAVTPDGAHLGVFWYDRRLDPANNLIDRFGVVGAISGATVTFGANFRVTDSSFPVVIGNDPNVVSNYMGDYDMAAADNTTFYTAWVDNRLSATAQYVFFTTVSVAGHAPIGAAPGGQLSQVVVSPTVAGSGVGALNWSGGPNTTAFTGPGSSPVDSGLPAVLSSPTAGPILAPQAARANSADRSSASLDTGLVNELFASAGITDNSSTADDLVPALARERAGGIATAREFDLVALAL